MHCLTSMLLMLVATVVTFAVAVPVIPGVALLPRQETSALPIDNPYVMGNLSYLFGWQMAGAATSDDQLAEACNDISALGNGKWAAMGFVPAAIQAPLCNASNSSPKPELSLQKAIAFGTDVFITQLLGSFATTQAFTYLCNNLDFDMIDGFLLTDTFVIKSACNAAGLPLPPRPFGDSLSPSANYESAVHAAKNTASVLYALMLSSGAVSTSELETNCGQASQSLQDWRTELLNGTLIQDILCTYNSPLSVEEAVAEVFTWVTRLFITTIENLSGVDGWLDWLCVNLDIPSMNAAGLYGAVVSAQVCLDSDT